MKEFHEVNYELVKFDALLEEDEIKKIISDSKYKNKLLKSILIDRISSTQRFIYFVYEETISETKNEFDYLIIKLERLNDSNEEMIEDLTKKLNEICYKEYELCVVVSDEDRMFLIFVSKLSGSGADGNPIEMKIR